jgi:Bifunctional DNA primase/polymerase, N-terminal
MIADTLQDDFLRRFNQLFEKREPLLVPCHCGSRKPRVKWTELTPASLQTDAYYQQALIDAIQENGNLAIKVGVDSHHLVMIDLDHDDLVDPFFTLNPELVEKTLITRGSKGAHVWFYAQGWYPPEVRRITIAGHDSQTGEWRGGKGLTTIWGVNSKGGRYEWRNEVAPIDYQFARIRWPDGWWLQKTPRINKPKFYQRLQEADCDLVSILVEYYFQGAIWLEDKQQWRCGGIDGRESTAQGSFEISAAGFCMEWDGAYPQNVDIIEVLQSSERETTTGLKICEEEIFTILKEHTGENFLITPRKAKTEDDEPTTRPTKGDANGDPEMAYVDEHFVYEVDTDSFFFRHDGFGWGPVSETRVNLKLRQEGNIPKKEHPYFKNYISNKNRVLFAVDAAGYDAGIHYTALRQPYLVTKTTNILTPEAGDWSWIHTIIDSFLSNTEEEDKRLGLDLLKTTQVGLFYSWLHWAMVALRDRTFAPGHYLILMGPPNCGKTLLQTKIIAPLLGGECVQPKEFLTRAADSSGFNKELLTSFCWAISDGLILNNYQERNAYTENLKEVLANPSQRVHGKFQTPISVPFNCRLTCGLNLNDFDNLPRLIPGMMDKLLILKGKSHQNTVTKEVPKSVYEERIKQALPAMAYDILNRWQIPTNLITSSTRFGFDAWIHPDIADHVDEISREFLLAELLCDIAKERPWVFANPNTHVVHRRSAGEFYSEFLNPTAATSIRFKELCRSSRQFDLLISVLATATEAGNSICGVKVNRGRGNIGRWLEISPKKPTNEP